MPYELRMAGRKPTRFETEPEAVAAARALVAEDANAEPEVIDLGTGQPAAPGADEASREELRTIVGF